MRRIKGKGYEKDKRKRIEEVRKEKGRKRMKGNG